MPLGELAALAAACFWSISSIAFTEATKRIGSFQVNLIRLMLATVVLALALLILRLPLDLSLHQVALLCASAIVGLAFGDTFLFKAFQEIGARLSMLVMSVAPAIAAALSFVVLGERISLLGAVGIGVTIVGVAAVVSEKKGTTVTMQLSFAGLLYALFGALGQGVGLIFARMAFDEGAIDGIVAAFVRIAVSVALLAPLGALTKRLRNPVSVIRSNASVLRFILVGTLFGPTLGITASLVAITYAPVGIAATIMAIVPILMLPIARWYYREPITARATVGAVIAVAGVAMLFLI